MKLNAKIQIIRVSQWFGTILSIFPLMAAGIILMPRVAHAATTHHYRAVFVNESELSTRGKAEIQIDAQNVAHIVIHLSGLTPGETYPAHIHEGASIVEPGLILYTLPDLVANQAGEATMVTTIPDADTLDLANRTIGVHLIDQIRIAKGEIN